MKILLQTHYCTHSLHIPFEIALKTWYQLKLWNCKILFSKHKIKEGETCSTIKEGETKYKKEGNFHHHMHVHWIQRLCAT